MTFNYKSATRYLVLAQWWVGGGGWINPLQNLPQGLVFMFDFDFDFDFDPDPD